MSKVNHRASSVAALFQDDNKRTKRDDRSAQANRRRGPSPKASVAPVQALGQVILPKVGDTIAILHQTEQDASGAVKLVRTTKEVRTVKAVYMSDDEAFHVKDSAGDAWAVKRATAGDTVWQTFVPERKRAE